MFRGGQKRPTTPTRAGATDQSVSNMSVHSDAKSEHIRQLEDEISVDRLVHSLVDPFTSDDANGGNNAPAANVPAAAEPGGGDDVSVMTGDGSILSRVTQASAGVGAVLSQSLALLRGENPLLEEQDESEEGSDSDGGRPMSPINTLMLPTIPSSDEAFQEEEEEAINGGAGSGRDVTNLSESQIRAKRATRISEKGSVESIDFLEDDPKDMTYSRRLALSLMDKPWYNPHAKEEDDKFGKKEGEKANKKDSRPLLGVDSGDTTENATNVQNSDSALVVPDEVLPESPRGKYSSSIVKMHKPSLEKAWAYFEHVTLPRYIFTPKPDGWKKKGLLTRMVRKMNKGDKQMDIAEPGENNYTTKLYSPIFTPLNQMGDFGLGIGLYFSTLRAVTMMTIVAGLMNIPNFIYYTSDVYSDGQPDIPTLLKGSAICTRQQFVPCPTCTPEQFETDPFRLAVAERPTASGETTTLYFSYKNLCADGATFQQGMVNYGTLLFFIVAVFAMNMYQKRKEVQFDEDEQTAQDYSVVICNPPYDAIDPVEWKNFFKEKFMAHTTVCTVGIDNDLLVKSLVERREIVENLKMRLPVGTSMDVLNLARIAAEEERKRRALGNLLSLVVRGTPELFGRLSVLNAKIQGLAQQNYPATNVFVSFETEAAQRKVLSAFSVGKIPIWRNNTKKIIDKSHLFRGSLVLDVVEADEPSTIRWQDLNAKLKTKIKQLFLTTAITVGAVVLVAVIVRLCRNRSTLFGAMAISIFNAIFPFFAKILTNMESHGSEGKKQTSLYVKIAGFRWVNTAIVITIIIPFTATLMNGKDYLLPGVYAIFFADIVTTNGLQILDIMGHINRHILAPRAQTQEGMNIKMQGTLYELAERYTNMTKLLFLALWYCPLYPAGLFLCALATFINYFVDRFCLMRSWKPAPKLGTRISTMSRKYFFSTAVIAFAVIGSYSWAGFPYDNLCDDGMINDSLYYGRWNVSSVDPEHPHTEIVTVGPRDESYRFCTQDLLRLPDVVAFPALPKYQPEGDEWMSDEQEHLTSIYGWTSLAIVCLVFLAMLISALVFVRNLFRGTYDPTGEDQQINFSDVPSISSYIPEVHSALFSYPLLAADIDGIDESLFEWEDPDKPFAFYDLTRDAEDLLRGTAITKDVSRCVFSRVMHWPPEEEKDN